MACYSVVIPAYNAEATVGEAIDSILAQTCPPQEIIVVDDGSTDRTAQIARAHGAECRVISQANAGPGAATTAGISLVATPVIAFLDADDLWLPTKMKHQLDFLEGHPDFALVSCLQRQFRDGVGDDGAGLVRPGLIRTGLVIRREVFEIIGPIIDPPGQRGDLVDWIARARAAGFKDHVMDEVLALRRILPGSLSWGRDRAKDVGYLAVAHAAMKRNRAAKGSAE